MRIALPGPTAAVVAAVALSLSLGLAACVAEPTPIAAPPQPSSAPIFASDEEALAAAADAYRKYQSASDAILRESGAGAERIDGLVSDPLASEDAAVFNEFAADGRRITGAAEVERIVFQSSNLNASGGRAVVVAYICLDVAGVDVLDIHGESLVSPSRPDLQEFEVEFIWADGAGLVPSNRVPWTGGGVC